MLLLWTCVVTLVATTSAAAHRVVESSEDLPQPPTATNTTTLFPVNTTAAADTSTIKSATSWKIETTFGASKLDSNSTESKEQLMAERPADNSSREFRPSPLLSSYVEDHSFLQPTREPDAFSNVIKKPPTGFISSPKDAFKPFSKLPKESFKNYQPFPYKFEPAIFTRAKDADGWKPTGGAPGGKPSPGHTGLLESRPTDEAPVRVPAGGLYKLPDPFKIKPGTTDDDFGLEFSGDVKENAPVKKRGNPWASLLHLLTALIPVGIIFSALTPSVITIEPENSLGPNIVRRGDGSFAPPPPAISERCRRRLLCELHNEANYQRAEGRRIKQCHRLRCEDLAALASTLQWLLAHRPPHT